MNGNNGFGGINLPWLRDQVESAVNSVAENIDNVLGRIPDPQQQHRRTRQGDDGNDSQRRQREHQQQPPPPPAAGFSFPFQHFQQWPQQAPPQSQNAVPPASARALRQLPTIRVAPEDLVDPSNRECCICLEPNCLGEIVSRLPCAHIFHSHCVIDWLNNHHCTCPVCRYELPTDDPEFEAGRIERMKHRKPRFAMHELQRMSISQLKSLDNRRGNEHPARKVQVIDKSDLIQLLIDSERVHLIPTPEPVSYELSVLKAMGIGQLKRTMEDAGVFFDRSMVVEKSDMITLFQNSGRLEIVPEVVRQISTDGSNREEDLHHRTSDELPNISNRSTGTTIDQQSSRSIAKGKKGSLNLSPNHHIGQMPCNEGRTIVETVESDGEDDDESPRIPEGGQTLSTPLEMFAMSEGDELLSRQRVTEVTYPSSNLSTAASSTSDLAIENASDSFEGQPPNEFSNSSELSNEVEASAFQDLSNSNRVEVPFDQYLADDSAHQTSITSASAEDQDGTPPNSDGLPAEGAIQGTRPFKYCSISELRSVARIYNVDLSRCVERTEMEHLLSAAGATVVDQEQPLSCQTFADWSASNILMLANEVDVDLSQCSDRDEMLRQLLQVTNNERPHVKQYLISLAPLASSSVSELRATAREWKININDCLEKEEIFRRLVRRGGQFGIF